MLPIEIHDRGRGPELKGTRITVYDVIPYRLQGRSAAEVAEVFRPGYPEITPAHIEVLFHYMDEHHEEVMAVHRRIEDRIARGNPPEIEAKLAQTSLRARAKLEELKKKRAASADQQINGPVNPTRAESVTRD